MLAFGHEHRHLDFSSSILKERYRIPHILSAGKCTEIANEYKVDSDGNATDESIFNGLLGREIILDAKGINVRTITFN